MRPFNSPIKVEICFSFFLVTGLIVVAYYYNLIYGNQLQSREKELIVQFKRGSNLEQIVEILAHSAIIKDKSTFKWVCSVMKFKGKLTFVLWILASRSSIDLLRFQEVRSGI
jgi:cell division protein YceG involved in septum cleavage